MTDSPLLDNTIYQTFSWFEKARPNPDNKDFHSQLGCHFEEVAEMVKEMSAKDTMAQYHISRCYTALNEFATYLKQNSNKIEVKDKEAFLDSICDQIVTVVGVAYIEKFKLIDALNEVNRSNYSKFVDGKPIFDENKKVQKGPDYFKADLSHFI